MCVYMCVYMCICVHVCVCVCAFVCACVCVCVCLYVCLFVYTCVHVCMWMHCVCVHLCLLQVCVRSATLQVYSSSSSIIMSDFMHLNAVVTNKQKQFGQQFYNACSVKTLLVQPLCGLQ